MDDTEFDRALISSAFALAAEVGWHRVSVVEAARRAELPLDRTRARFPVRAAVLLRFGVQADQAALAGASGDAPRDRLFELLMRRFDALQANRAGILALMRAIPTDPPLALLLGLATKRSMRWMLEAAGISGRGPVGELRTRGLVGVWLYALRTWQSDQSEDLSATMAALDRALRWAERAEQWLPGHRRSTAAGDAGEPVPPEPEPPPAPPTDEPPASPPV